MKKINWNNLIFTCILCLMPICIGLYFYDELPDIMAIHFNIENVADNFGPKNFVIFGLPIIMALLQAFCCIISDINEAQKGKSPKLVKIMKWIIPFLTIVMYMLTILVGLGKDVNIGKIISIILGVMFMIMGNYMPKMTYEDAKGNIKTLPSNENTFKTMMRVLGYTFVFGGFATMLGVLVSNKISFILLMGMCLLVFIESTYFSLKKD